MHKPTKRQMYSASLVSLAIALAFLVAHFVSGWEAAQIEAKSHNEQAVMREYMVEWTRDFTENMQSEFFQLSFQFGVLAGILAFAGIHAYEEDMEEVKRDLASIKKHLDIE